jgi:hypothetical protein
MNSVLPAAVTDMMNLLIIPFRFALASLIGQRTGE